VWQLITGGERTELDELIKGIQQSFSELNFETVGQQIGSGLSALVVVNIVGTLFLISPGLIGVVCFVCGVIWPTWIGGAYRRLAKKISDTAAKGRRELALKSFASEGRYHYFLRDDGTKRWYRTGKPMRDSLLPEKKNIFGKPDKNAKKTNGEVPRFSWPAFLASTGEKRKSK